MVFVEDATGYLNSIDPALQPLPLGFPAPPRPRIRWSAAPLDSSTLPWWTPLPNSSTCLSVTAAPTELPLSTPATSTSLLPAPPSTQVTGTTTRNLTTKATNDIGTVQYHGMFDNAYYDGFGNYRQPLRLRQWRCLPDSDGPASAGPSPHTTSPGYSVYHTPASTVSDAAACSALTEYCNNGSSACTVSGGVTNAGTDYLFLSLDANGKTVGSTTCAGGCIYNYNITSGGATGTPADALQVAGGSGSIVIDNSGSATGESQVYYGSLSSQTCAGNGASSGTGASGSGSCAVQASQSALQ